MSTGRSCARLEFSGDVRVRVRVRASVDGDDVSMARTPAHLGRHRDLPQLQIVRMRPRSSPHNTDGSLVFSLQSFHCRGHSALVHHAQHAHQRSGGDCRVVPDGRRQDDCTVRRHLRPHHVELLRGKLLQPDRQSECHCRSYCRSFRLHNRCFTGVLLQACARGSASSSNEDKYATMMESHDTSVATDSPGKFEY